MANQGPKDGDNNKVEVIISKFGVFVMARSNILVFKLMVAFW